jgi:hypothetical protein
MRLFPESGFDQSAITPVFLGVLVSWFFTETFGWVFLGLVVPGYLATLFLLDPRSAAIDVLEAVLSYGVARGLCEHLSWTGLTSRIFGRERFLVILLVSVLVRLGVEGALIPWALPHAKWAYSIGLVVVPLLANACWKTGLVRGAVQNGVPTLIVYALLRFLLVPHTNLSLAGFHLSIEDVARSFLNSPRAYVLLVTGAVFAAIANVRYGWDYGGILIPALIALVVATPSKLAATFLEALLLLAIIRVVVRFTAVGRWNIEGPRRTVLFLSVDYALRFSAAALLGRHLPGTEMVELTGLGYLLPSLLAVKAAQRTIATVFLPTLTVSVAAFLISSASALVVERVEAAVPPDDPAIARSLGVPPDTPLLAAVWLSALARSSAEHAAGVASQPVRARVRAIGAWANGDRAALLGLEVQAVGARFVLVRERFADLEHRHGFPAAILPAQRARAPRTVALVPAPLASPEAAALAGRWLERSAVDAVVIAGVEAAKAREFEDDEALATARALADAGDNRGLVVAIRAGSEPCSSRGSSRTSQNLAARAFLAQHENDASACDRAPDEARRGEDLALEVGRASADSWLDALPAGPALSTSSALSLGLSQARLSSAQPSLEDVLVLRRLVLEPLLGGEATPSLPLSAAAARSVGYALLGPSSLPSGEPGLLLLPGAAGGALALVMRVGGVRGLSLEVPHAGNAELRSLALSLAKPLRADALLLGLEAHEGAIENQLFAAAHAAAVWPRSGRAASIVSFRTRPGAPGQSADDSLGLAEWGGLSARRLGDRVASALAVLALPTRPEPLDLATRDQAGRSVFGDTPLVTVTVPLDWLRIGGHSVGLESLRAFQGFAWFDSPISDALAALARALPVKAGDAPESVFDTARTAASERSIVAIRSLEDLTFSSACRAGIALADSGAFLLLIVRQNQRLRVSAYPLLPHAEPVRPERVVAGTLAECATEIVSGGICTVEARR